MRIAVLLHGGIGQDGRRSSAIKSSYIDPQICYDHYKHFDIIKDSYDVYFHTWENPYVEKLVELYKPVNYKVEKQKYFNDIPKEGSMFGLYSRLYSAYKANELMVLNKKEYDLVFLTRFDLCFHTKLDLESFDPNYMYAQDSIYINKHWNNWYVSDWWFASKQSHINKFVFEYHYLKEHLKPKIDMPRGYVHRNGEVLSPQHFACRSIINKHNFEMKYTLYRDQDHCLVRNVLNREDPQTGKDIWIEKEGIYYQK